MGILRVCDRVCVAKAPFVVGFLESLVFAFPTALTPVLFLPSVNEQYAKGTINTGLQTLSSFRTVINASKDGCI